MRIDQNLQRLCRFLQNRQCCEIPRRQRSRFPVRWTPDAKEACVSSQGTQPPGPGQGLSGRRKQRQRLLLQTFDLVR